MKKKMINGFPMLFTHNTPLYHHKTQSEVIDPKQSGISFTTRRQ
jgi:hypothetical protein